MKKLIFTIITLFFITIADSSNEDCFKNIGWGPIHYHISSPLRGLKNNLIPMTPFPMKAGDYKYRTSYSWINVWNYKKDYFMIDLEVLSMDHMLSIGFKNDYVVNINFPLYYLNGGILDREIENFHSALGITNANREIQPRNSMKYWVKDIYGNVFETTKKELQGLDRGNINIILQKNIYSNPKLPRGFFLNFQLPTKTLSETLNVKKGDITVSYAWVFNTGQKFHYINVGLTKFRENFLGPIHFEKYNAGIFYTVETVLNSKKHAFFQLQFSQKITKDVPEFDKSTYIVNYGWKWKNGRNVFTFSFMENILNFDNSPDVGFYFSREFYGNKTDYCPIK
ncbi:MAG: DUF3187 family protein [Candidatus Muirbacterium halophilum]|nr:DUF3187 family protein [Candidatus Muirbacterium halophilum]MCK9477236.1 DUF3187 family protein [Candidatus Muirbacterium halophilum]